MTKKEEINEAINWFISFKYLNEKQEKYKNIILEYITFLEENIDFVECFDLLNEEIKEKKEI